MIEIEVKGNLGLKKAQFDEKISHKLSIFAIVLLSQIQETVKGESPEIIAEQQTIFIDSIKNKLLIEQFVQGDAELISDSEYSYFAGMQLYNKLYDSIFRQEPELKKN